MTTETKLTPDWSAELPELLTSAPGLLMAGLCRIRQALAPAPAPELADDVALDDDPATPENRRALACRLLAGAIRRYEEASLEWTAVYESFPPLDPPRQPEGPEEIAERSAWRSLLNHADENFNLAELNLAERIHGLFDVISPPGVRAADDPSGYFVPRAVRSGDSVYVLAYSAFEYEPKTNIIAVYRADRVIDLGS